jgi:hypothetical protein
MSTRRPLPPMTREKLERLEARVRLVDLAKAARIPVSALSELETGTRIFSERLARRRADALKRLRVSEESPG